MPFRMFALFQRAVLRRSLTDRPHEKCAAFRMTGAALEKCAAFRMAGAGLSRCPFYFTGKSKPQDLSSSFSRKKLSFGSQFSVKRPEAGT